MPARSDQPTGGPKKLRGKAEFDRWVKTRNLPATHAKSKGSTPKRRTVNPKNLPSTKGRKRNSAK